MSGSPFRDVAGVAKGPLDADAWNARWRDGNTPWDMGRPAPPFVGALERGLVSPPGRALVVGCGAGHDARLLATRGFDVTAIDVADRAIERARDLTLDGAFALDWRVADLFALPPELGSFDLVLEHTCFCAVHPNRRDAYVDAVADALSAGGALLGLFFVFEAEEGPPFGASEEELRHRFGRRFDVEHAAVPPDSHEARAGREMLFLMRKAR